MRAKVFIFLKNHYHWNFQNVKERSFLELMFWNSNFVFNLACGIQETKSSFQLWVLLELGFIRGTVVI